MEFLFLILQSGSATLGLVSNPQPWILVTFGLLMFGISAVARAWTGRINSFKNHIQSFSFMGNGRVPRATKYRATMNDCPAENLRAQERKVSAKRVYHHA